VVVLAVLSIESRKRQERDLTPFLYGPLTMQFLYHIDAIDLFFNNPDQTCFTKTLEDNETVLDNLSYKNDTY
jgi:hypothetical protein